MAMNIRQTGLDTGHATIDGAQGLSDRHKILTQSRTLPGDTLDQPAALDGKFNQVLIHCRRRS